VEGRGGEVCTRFVLTDEEEWVEGKGVEPGIVRHDKSRKTGCSRSAEDQGGGERWPMYVESTTGEGKE